MTSLLAVPLGIALNRISTSLCERQVVKGGDKKFTRRDGLALLRLASRARAHMHQRMQKSSEIVSTLLRLCIKESEHQSSEH